MRGVIRCGRIWDCPACSFAISQQRSREVLQAINGCQAADGGVALASLTFPHYRGDNLRALREGLTQALRHLVMGAPWKRLRERFGIHGTIRSLEVTWGDANGWHPHVHLMMFCDQPEDVEALQLALSDLWLRACVRGGLPEPSEEYGCVVLEGYSAAEYVAKWGLHAELVLHQLKRGRRTSLTPWEILARLDHTGEALMAHLWREYVSAFEGARQLVWSKGLKARYAIEDKTDDDLVVAPAEADEVLWMLLDRELWRYVYRNKLIGEVLRFAGADDRPGLISLLAGVSASDMEGHG